ncbi:PucR family transcriptional regulator [Arthrobacter sp. R4]|uniref:PucR family transcriptional regulator n=1 Tax=Arthrobacter sp. R4 TaxID=644417 RepID=UPI003ED9D0C6
MDVLSRLIERARGPKVWLLAGKADVDVRAVALVAALPDLASVPAHTVVVVAREAIERAASYQLDVAVRIVADKPDVVVVLAGLAALPATTKLLADRNGVTVLGSDPEVTEANLLVHVDSVIRGDPADTVARTLSALRILSEHDQSLPDEMITVLSAELGMQITLSSFPPEAVGKSAPILVSGRAVEWVTIHDFSDVAAFVIPALASYLSGVREEEFHRREGPRRARQEVITELLVTDNNGISSVAERARGLGIPIDGAHCAAVFRLSPPTDSDPVTLQATRNWLARVLVDEVGQISGWLVCSVGNDVLLLRSDPDARAIASANMVGMLERLLALATSKRPEIELLCGLGTVQRGVTGMRQSALEARSAAAGSKARGRHGGITAFDESGLNRALTALADSWAGQRLSNDLLAPFDSLPKAKATTAIDTLSAYLDHGGSLSAAGTKLHIHPKAVRYRIDKALELLRMDIDDPDNRLAVQLACRIRLQQRRDDRS